jgi:aminopeptidase N
VLARVLSLWAALGIAGCVHGGRADEPPAAPGELVAARSDRVPPYDVERYDASLRVFPGERSIAGEVEILLRTRDPAVRRITLEARGLRITQVLAAGSPAEYVHEGPELHVAVPAAAGRGAFPVRITYDGRPERGMVFGPGRVHTAFNTGSWMVSNPWPGDKAALRLEVTLPSELQAVSGGRLLRRDELAGGLHRYVWEQASPMSSYLFGFAAARFAESRAEGHPVALGYYGVGFTPAELDRVFQATGPALAFFTRAAGAPYPGSRYLQVLMPGAGAQELVEMSIMDTAYGRAVLRDSTEDHLVAHELAHAWWGNALTAGDWTDFWLNEGITTFMVAAYKERRWGRDAYEREIILARGRYERALQAGRRAVRHAGWTVPSDAGGPITYSGGALFMHLLRSELGDDAFWRGFRDYTRAGLATGVVRTEDLQRAMERHGGRSLGALFAAWLDSPDPPPVVARHEVGDGRVRVFLRSDAAVTVVVAVESGGTRTRRRVKAGPREQAVDFAIPGEVTSVRVDEDFALPRRPVHPRSVPMLVHQLAREPDAPGRAEALAALSGQCAPASVDPECAEAVPAVQRAARDDPAPAVRQLAARWLAERPGGR